ncbi:hypothetical protein PLICRDRAFT_368606 [Plicaturopsis crispa FD-325 SS-3]|uniref:Uncharacterized protein n=1 Tax=Plicaturopsis crispa FD-325 SS-3 TaxID=944288 RepID=A0A0C9SKP3_PLICR|nr:hypothetical protein PLICRDRAFT_368606 [Plicaturopsis crispa FD-325 SS-3]
MGPQELSDEDFKEFHRLEKTEGLSDPYTKAETTWAAIHDRCYNSDSRYFILTNYNMWILGSFSPNLSVVYQTPLMCCDQKDPTMMQCLALWIAMAASATPNPLRFPEDEPADYDEVPCTFGDLAKCPAEELAELYAVASLY